MGMPGVPRGYAGCAPRVCRVFPARVLDVPCTCAGRCGGVPRGCVGCAPRVCRVCPAHVPGEPRWCRVSPAGVPSEPRGCAGRFAG
eukprot:9495245-Pyramimonas_sp.AAC.1